ncbi:unnamed protein product [Leptosia nina]|uniref:Uncharacterized protein n=1 Tax=Leptosia nina TaxID=320188 RepID=A0AAV1JVV4_9NEOP
MLNSTNHVEEKSFTAKGTNPNTNASVYLLKAKRKTVLIVNSDMILRAKYPKKTTSLLYQDFDDDEKLLNSYYMYTLDDVAEFFRVFLDTEICHETCRNKVG